MVDRIIPELRQKLRGLMQSQIAQKVGGYRGNLNSFGNATIGRPAMRSLLEVKKASAISEDHERIVAKCCRFAVDWQPWQIGKASEFIAHYERMHRLGAASRPTNVMLAKGPEVEPEPSPIKGLLSIQAFPAQYGRGTVQIGFELSCGQLRASHGLLVDIRSGILELRCFPATVQRSSRRGFDRPWQWTGSQGDVKFEWSVGSTFAARWRLTASSRSIGNLDVPPDFVTVEALAPDDEIEISFGFRVKDFGLSEDADAVQFNDGSGSNDDVVVQPSSEPSITPDSQTLSLVKRRILARLAAEALVDDGDGLVVHARHQVGFIECQSNNSEQNAKQ